MTAAGYSLYGFDPVTKVGLVESVRVEDGYQRRGLARAMLTVGIDRLAMKGAHRVKLGTEPKLLPACTRTSGSNRHQLASGTRERSI